MVKAEVCKTSIHRFESGRRLHYSRFGRAPWLPVCEGRRAARRCALRRQRGAHLRRADKVAGLVFNLAGRQVDRQDAMEVKRNLTDDLQRQ